MLFAFSISDTAVQDNWDTEMNLHNATKDGYSVETGLAGNKWFAAVLHLENVDEKYVAGYEEFPQVVTNLHSTAVLKPGKCWEDWKSDLEKVKRRLILVTEGGMREEIAVADRIGGFSVAEHEKTPAVAWSEKVEGQWRMLFLTPDNLKCLFVSRAQYWNASMGWLGDKAVIAYEYWDGKQEMVGVRNQDGQRLFTVPGRRPKISTNGIDTGVLVLERKESYRSFILTSVVFNEKGIMYEARIPTLNDINNEASIAYDKENDCYYTAFTACPAWGMDDNLGVFRDMGTFVLTKDSHEWKAVQSTFQGSIPQPITGGSSHIKYKPHEGQVFRNAYAPRMPRVFVLNGQPAVAYRSHHTWHLFKYSYTTLTKDGWAMP